MHDSPDADDLGFLSAPRGRAYGRDSARDRCREKGHAYKSARLSVAFSVDGYQACSSTARRVQRPDLVHLEPSLPNLQASSERRLQSARKREKVSVGPEERASRDRGNAQEPGYRSNPQTSPP